MKNTILIDVDISLQSNNRSYHYKVRDEQMSRKNVKSPRDTHGHVTHTTSIAVQNSVRKENMFNPSTSKSEISSAWIVFI